MSAKILFWLFTLIGAGLEITGDIFFKKWVIENKPFLVWMGFIVYLIATVFWAISLKYEMLSKAISIFTILNLVIVSLVGVLIFKENISLLSKIGIILGVISIILIQRG
ncbi:MAG: EamA family transporter [Candidatus Buchananbacteria bacterium]